MKKRRNLSILILARYLQYIFVSKKSNLKFFYFQAFRKSRDFPKPEDERVLNNAIIILRETLSMRRKSKIYL